MDRTEQTEADISGLGRILRGGFFDLSYPMIRFAIGAILFMHGYAKIANLGIAKVAANFGTNYGLPMPTFLAYSAVFLETVGAICIAIGLFTRFFAAASPSSC